MNVQQTIIKGIRELLFVHNYLVLPGFGGFVLKAGPAHFGSSGAQLLPSSKTVSFNAQLRQNDGILAIWLQEKLHCPASEALQHLHDFSGFCSSVLTARRRLTLDRIGFFYLDFENNTCFEPQADVNFLTDSFGLGPVSVREIEVPVTEPKRERVFVDRPAAIADAPLPKAPRRYSRLVAPAVLSVLLFSLLLLFVANNRFSGQFNASVFGKGSTGAYQPLDYEPLKLASIQHITHTYVADANGIATFELGNDKHIAVNIIENAGFTTNKEHSVKTRRAGNFEIVLGCFTVADNATRMAGKLAHRHIDAEISGRNDKGMYTVSEGHFITKEEAIERLKELKVNFPKAWIKPTH